MTAVSPKAAPHHRKTDVSDFLTEIKTLNPFLLAADPPNVETR